jgi:hypothetical protein
VGELAEIMISKHCFWFYVGNPEIALDGGAVLKAQPPGCYLDEHGFGVRACNGICPQFYTTDREIIKMLKGNDYQAAREWQKKGRPKAKKAKESGSEEGEKNEDRY